MNFKVPAFARLLLFRGKSEKLNLNKVNAFYGENDIEQINSFPGLIWKVWAISDDGKYGSGYYLFDTKAHAELRAIYAKRNYWRKGITGLHCEIENVLEDCSRGTRAPIDLMPTPDCSESQKADLICGKLGLPVKEMIEKYKYLKGVN